MEARVLCINGWDGLGQEEYLAKRDQALGQSMEVFHPSWKPE